MKHQYLWYGLILLPCTLFCMNRADLSGTKKLENIRSEISRLRSAVLSHDPGVLSKVIQDATRIQDEAIELGYRELARQADSVVRIATSKRDINPAYPPQFQITPLPEK